MSVHRRIPDLPPRGAEGRSLTQPGHSAYSRFRPRTDIQGVNGKIANVPGTGPGVAFLHLNLQLYPGSKSDRQQTARSRRPTLD